MNIVQKGGKKRLSAAEHREKRFCQYHLSEDNYHYEINTK